MLIPFFVCDKIYELTTIDFAAPALEYICYQNLAVWQKFNLANGGVSLPSLLDTMWSLAGVAMDSVHSTQ